jgi:hypothetical protein
LSQPISLDLNNPVFQRSLFELERTEALAALATFRKLSQIDWNGLYKDKGLHWELIQSRLGPQGQRIYSLRITKKSRAVAYRDGNYLRFLSFHSDHDSAYRA